MLADTNGPALWQCVYRLFSVLNSSRIIDQISVYGSSLFDDEPEVWRCWRYRQDNCRFDGSKAARAPTGFVFILRQPDSAIAQTVNIGANNAGNCLPDGIPPGPSWRTRINALINCSVSAYTNNVSKLSWIHSTNRPPRPPYDHYHPRTACELARFGVVFSTNNQHLRAYAVGKRGAVFTGQELRGSPHFHRVTGSRPAQFANRLTAP